MDSLVKLRTVLDSILSGRPVSFGEQDLIDELLVNEGSIVSLLDVGPRNPREQEEIQKGNIIIDGKSIVVDSYFAQLVNFLAQHLQCSERHLAGLLLAMPPSCTVEEKLEGVIHHFHAHRNIILDCVDRLLALTLAVLESSSPVPPLASRVASFVRSHLFHPTPTSSWASRVFNAITSISQSIVTVSTAVQNAASTTMAPTPSGNPSFGSDVLTQRFLDLRNERQRLADFLVTLSKLGALCGSDIKTSVDYLAMQPIQPMTYAILTSLLYTLDITIPESQTGHSQLSLCSDATLVTFMRTKLRPSAQGWPDQGLKSVILLRWTLFQINARELDPALETKDGFNPDDLESQISNAIQGDAFTYIARCIQHIRKDATRLSPLIILPPSPDVQGQLEIPASELQRNILSSFEILIRSLIYFASPELRKIKQRQEDLVLASARTAANQSRFGARVPRHAVPETQSPPRDDIVTLFSVIGLLYHSVEAECALQFWGSVLPESNAPHSYLQLSEANEGRLPGFLQWAVWSTQPHHIVQITALYNMLGGLANGRHCSELAYNFMANGGGEVIPGSSMSSNGHTSSPASWQSGFNTLNTFASPPATSLGLSNQSHHLSSQPSNALSSEHVLLGCSFLFLVSTVISHSIAARRALFSNSHFRPVVSLSNIISLSIPLELKGAIFDTLATFCLPGAGLDGLEMCRSVWYMLEKLEVINVRPLSAGFSALSPVKGVEMELDQVESVNKTYPVSMSFLRLLCTLLHTPKRVPLRDRDDSMLITFPEALGQPYRLPGLGPYTTFVLDNVLSGLGGREFNDISDQWEMLGLCLCYVERGLASYKLEDLYLSYGAQPRRETVLPFLLHPGYDIMRRLLQESPLSQTILSFLMEGMSSLDRKLVQGHPAFVSAIVRLLRIVHRTLELQDYFLDVLVPILSDIDCSSIIGTTPTRSSFTSFNQALSFASHVIPCIAAYSSIEEYGHSELGLLSVKILTTLLTSQISPFVTAQVESSDYAPKILEGFCRILSLDSLEDPNSAMVAVEQSTGAGAPDFQPGQTYPQAVRLAVLDFLIKNTTQDSRFPNLAHFFFFGGKDRWSSRSCGRVLLKQVSHGIPTLTEEDDHSISVQPLFATLPALAERCYRIIYQLCIHPKSPSFLMRDLRTEDFFARQLYAVPVVAPAADSETFIEVVYTDGTRIVSTSSAFSSFLKLRSWILELGALDLHFLTNGRFGTKVSDILNILFATRSSLEPSSFNQGFNEIGHSRMRIIEYVQSLTFDWTDSLAVPPVELEFLGNLDLSGCTAHDESGHEVIDRAALLGLLSAAKRQLHVEGRITSEKRLEQVEAEKAYILQSCAVENNRRSIVHAIALSYQSWRRLLDVMLTKCFSRLPPQSRESVLFDLLYTLPPIIPNQVGEPSTTILLSETILSCMNKLREDRYQQRRFSNSGLLPAERLETILKNILQSLLDANRLEQVRGNLYAVLINFLNLVQHPCQSKPGEASALVSFEQSNPTSSPLVSACFSQIKNVLDKLALTVARDAIDGTEIWRTVAFMLLDALIQIPVTERKNNVIHALVRHGILDNFVRGLKESDERLQTVLLPDPDDLNALYIFEAKMSFFIAAAQTRIGAERLLDAKLITTLAHCDFLDARPEVDQSFAGQDSFLPSSIQRYHQLFLPSIQVVNAILTTLTSNHTTTAGQVLDFLRQHAATIIILLKETNGILTIPMLQEIHLLISLCSAAISVVPKSELLSATSSYGSIHAAIMSVSTKFLSGPRWIKDVLPQSGMDMSNSTSIIPAQSPTTRFDLEVKNVQQTLMNALVQYIGSACGFSDSNINVVLSPVVASGSYGDRGAGFLATMPTISDVSDTLDVLCGELMDTLTRIQILDAEIAAKEHNDNGLLPFHIDPATFNQLDMTERQEVVAEMFTHMQWEQAQTTKQLLSCLEMLLLLAWRHIIYYLDGHQQKDKLQASASLAHTMRLLANVEPETFKADVAKRLGPVLERLHSLQLDETLPDWKLSLAYVNIMTRRLKGALGLHKDDDSDMDT